ncbi:MAG TPA: T9SS type A sorting domain-containing protein, partial [Flavobacteriaceae bacterium]|nr:T9SS type A sorting domain-containing protein [Flavobacteriaceae bacterium]
HLYFTFFLTAILTQTALSQIGPLEIIDNGSQSIGISKIISADLDQNGFDDIIASFTGNNGKLGYYLNINGSDFSSFQLIDAVSFSEGVAVGDFNNDSWNDILMIGGINFEAFLYTNNNGTFSGPVTVDSNISISSINDVEVADFDGDGSDDLVIIGQYSIVYYRNDGSGNFNKEPILTASTSPEPLECLDLAIADFNSDGHLDLVVGETAGLVVYINSGNGVFTPHYYSTISEVGFIVHPFDIDADGDMDVLMQNSFGEKKWYRNDGSGTMSFEANLTIAPDLHSYISIDYNNDGLEDVYASYLNNVSVFLNDANHTFSTEISIAQNNNLYMDELALVDIDDNGARDYVWSGLSNTLAYHFNTSNLTIKENQKSPRLVIYPNPTNESIMIDADIDGFFSLDIYDMTGQLIYGNPKTVSKQSLDISHLQPGSYLVEITNNGQSYAKKLVVE